MTFLEITEWIPPDHPWDKANQVAGYCLTCGAGEIVHDGNLERVFEWMARLP